MLPAFGKACTTIFEGPDIVHNLYSTHWGFPFLPGQIGLLLLYSQKREKSEFIARKERKKGRKRKNGIFL